MAKKWLSTRLQGAAATGAKATGAAATGALSAGAMALGAVAVGAFAIGRLAIGRAKIGRVDIGELVVDRLKIGADSIGQLTAMTHIRAIPGKGDVLEALFLEQVPEQVSGPLLRRSTRDPDLFVIQHEEAVAWLEPLHRHAVEEGLIDLSAGDHLQTEVFRTIERDVKLPRT